MPPFGSHEARVAARPLLSPVEFAEKMAHDVPLVFSENQSFGDPGLWHEDVYNTICRLLTLYFDDSIPLLACSIAHTIDSCIEAGIRAICEEFETEGSYDVLHLRLERLRLRTRSISGPMHKIFQNGENDGGPGFHRQLFRNPRMTILNEVVRVCKIQLVPVIQKRIMREFAQHRDIQATSFALQQLATRFDDVGNSPHNYPIPKPHTMGLAAAQICARVLLPQMEQAYGAITEAIIMSLDPLSDHTSILHRILAHEDFRSITPLMGSRYEAMQFCHALANAHVVGVPPALLDNCPDFFRR